MTKQCVGVVMIVAVIINHLTKQLQTFFNFCKDDLLSAFCFLGCPYKFVGGIVGLGVCLHTTHWSLMGCPNKTT